MLIPLDKLKLEFPHQSQPGTLLFQDARYDRPPLFICKIGEQQAAFQFAPQAQKGFMVDAVAQGMGLWLSAGEPQILVDPTSTISPTRSDIPLGAACIMEGDIRFAVKHNHATFYAGLDGSLTHPENYDTFVAFAKWKIQVAAAADEMFTVYEADLPRVTKPY